MTHGPSFWLPNIVQPIGTVLIGIAGSFIAVRQWITASEKFRFDLFARRFEIYKDVNECLSHFVRVGENGIDFDYIEKLERRTDEVYLFFGAPIGRSVQSATISARRLFVLSKSSSDFRDLESTLDTQDKLFHEITRAATSVPDLMKTFIDFSRAGVSPSLRSLWQSKMWIRILVDLIGIKKFKM